MCAQIIQNSYSFVPIAQALSIPQIISRAMYHMRKGNIADRLFD